MAGPATNLYPVAEYRSAVYFRVKPCGELMLIPHGVLIDPGCPECGYSTDLQPVDAKAKAAIFYHNCKSGIRLQGH